MSTRTCLGLALLFATLVASFAALAQERESVFDGFRVVPAWEAASRPPASHADAQWRADHGAAAMDPTACTSCHTPETCASCHAAENVPGAVHPAGWVLLHGASDTTACTSCHTTTRFCTSCHAETELLDAPADRPPAWFAFHPDGWNDPGSGAHHGDAARSDLGSCASCHTGDTCASCHIDVSPHDSAFLDACDSYLDAGAPTCARCHTFESRVPMDALRADPRCAR